MGLHHATLKAAVALYAILLTQGKTEAEIKEAISSDEKEFKANEVEEIYAAILAQSKQDSNENGNVNLEAAVNIPRPEWLDELIRSNEAMVESNNLILISNQKVIESNNELTEALENFSHTASDIASPEIFQKINIDTLDFDPETDYVVSEGKSFRHPNDFSKEFKSGNKVNGLAVEKLKSLYGQGLIEKA